MIPTGQVGSSNALTKQHVPANQESLGFAVKTYMSGRMAGSIDHFKFIITQPNHITFRYVMQIALVSIKGKVPS